MEHYHFKSILGQVTTLNNHYKRINELTGENFNVFRILKLEASEVRMHSAFLAAMLDPNGTHGQRDKFLRLFIKQFCFKQNGIDTINCKVELEKHVGFISKDKTEGGRIDIVISDRNGNNILIENKIYAGDQNYQLTRYHKHSRNADLIYLTLDGRLPDVKSFDKLIKDTHFKCYSYHSDIILWLEECRKETVSLPIVRESITQYINLIKHLTNQTTNETMQRELNELLLTNLEASFTIADNLDNALYSLLISDFIPKLEKVCIELGTTLESGINFNQNYSGMRVIVPGWKYLNINFEFQSRDKDLIYGVSAQHDPEKLITEELRLRLKALGLGNAKSTIWWPLFYKADSPYNNWTKYEAWKAIEDGSMLSYIKGKIIYLLEITRGIEM